jgi:hypothetical protein
MGVPFLWALKGRGVFVAGGGGVQAATARKRPRDSEVDQRSVVNRNPCRNGGPTARPPGGSTQTTAPSTVIGPLGVSRVMFIVEPGGRTSGRRSNRPPQLISPVKPWMVVRLDPVGVHVTEISSGTRTPAFRTCPLEWIRSRKARS